MEHPIEWIMHSPEYKWFYDANMDAIVATTTMVIHTYFHLGHMHGVVEPDISPTLKVIPEAPLHHH